MTATQERTRARAASALRRPPHRNAAIVITIAIAMTSLFAISYSLALGRPTPHHIPASIVGSPAADPPAIAALEHAAENGLHFTPASSAAEANRLIGSQRVYAALVLGHGTPRLLVASAAGVSVARFLEQAASAASEQSHVPIAVRDAHPLPAADPQGLVSFYVTLAATILGFVTMFQLRANASLHSLRGWFVCIYALAISGGLVLALITDPLIGALRGAFIELWASIAAQIAVAALFNCTMLTLIGRWAMIPTWGLFVAIGNAASGGAVAPPLLPPFYAFIGSFLPSGATVQTIRNAVYFRSQQHLEPILVEIGWLLATLIAFTAATRIRGRTPASA